MMTRCSKSGAGTDAIGVIGGVKVRENNVRSWRQDVICVLVDRSET
jgi:hypothetical protein